MSQCGSGCESRIAVTRGITKTQTYRASINPLVYKDVSAVVSLTPLTLTVVAHGLENGWSVAFVGDVNDLKARSSPPRGGDFHSATVIDVDTLQFNDIDATRFEQQYTSGGKIAYYTPDSLAGKTVEFNIYTIPSSADPQTPFLTVDCDADDTAKIITVVLTAAQTATLLDTEYAFNLVMIDGSNKNLLDEGFLDVEALGAK